MTMRQTVGIFVLAGALCAAGGAAASTGTGDSPLFSLNTDWISAVEDLQDLPARDSLGGCFPNPFNPLTKIRFELAHPTAVDLKIYDLQGRLVRVLVANELLNAGRYESEWSGRDERGAKVATGVYLYRLVTDSFSGSHRMTLIK
jgi:hypothetical protein